MSHKPAAGGGHWAAVAPERLEGWLARFADRHGACRCRAGDTLVTVTAADGAVAECHVPFPPLTVEPAAPYGGLPGHALRDRRVGVLLVRKGGYAAGVFDGRALQSSKVGTRRVQGRSAAGGQSQQRFARRRQGQARVANEAAADTAARVLLPVASTLEALVLGGSRAAVGEVLEDPRLKGLQALAVEPFLDVPDPRLRVLTETPKSFRAVRIRVVEPPSAGEDA